MLILNDVTHLYEHLPMRFTLSVTAGEKIAIMGPSGAGKSTLLNLIAGFIIPDSGTIVINGVNHTHSSPAARPVSMLFQHNNLFTHLTVEQNIGLGIHPGLRLNAAQKEDLLTIARQVELEPYLHRLPEQLSGGQRQRAALARCFVSQQPLLLLDEPFSALDPALRKEMLGLLRNLCQVRQKTLLMVSHNLDDALAMADRTVLIVDGRIYYDGATQPLLTGKIDASHFLGLDSNK